MEREFERYLTPPYRFLVARPPILWLILFTLFGSFFLPWHAFTSGKGRVTALDPVERIQEINAPITGFIEKWHVTEGSEVKKGDLILELVDADPGLMGRIQMEKVAAQEAVDSAQLALNTAKINLDRQEKLFREGLASRKEYEKAKIEHSKLAVEASKALAVLTKAQTQVSRQSTQRILSPRDGRILRLLPGEGNQLVKSGEALVVFAPEVTSPAVEVWVSGSDIPFIRQGQMARVQFEGWPSVQIAGWPSLSIGIFDARVRLVDHASSFKGRFRVLLVPHGRWPSSRFLRLNANARGVIFLRKTMVGVELWRQLNDFPPGDVGMQDELALTRKKEKNEEESKEEK